MPKRWSPLRSPIVDFKRTPTLRSWRDHPMRFTDQQRIFIAESFSHLVSSRQVQPRIRHMLGQRIAAVPIAMGVREIGVKVACLGNTHDSGEIVAVGGTTSDDDAQAEDGNNGAGEKRQAVDEPEGLAVVVVDVLLA